MCINLNRLPNSIPGKMVEYYVVGSHRGGTAAELVEETFNGITKFFIKPDNFKPNSNCKVIKATKFSYIDEIRENLPNVCLVFSLNGNPSSLIEGIIDELSETEIIMCNGTRWEVSDREDEKCILVFKDQGKIISL